MAKTRVELKAIATRLGNIPSSYNGTNEDLEIGCQLVAAMKNWPELMKADTLNLTSADGDTVYPLAADTDKVEQMRITNPTSYARVLPQISKTRLRQIIPDKTLPGVSPPSRWYYSEPTISTANVQTQNVSFDYRPDRSYTVTYSYKSNAPAFDGDDDYPFFDGNYHHILTYFAVWKYAERSADPSLNPIYWRGEWESGIRELINSYSERTTMLMPIPGPDEVF